MVLHYSYYTLNKIAQQLNYHELMISRELRHLKLGYEGLHLHR